MKKVWQIAAREFVATVFTKGFIIGLLIVPLLGVLLVTFAPRLFGDRDRTVEGEIAVIDPTGVVLPRVRTAISARRSPVAVTELVERARAGDASDMVLNALGATTRLTLVERPAGADVEQEKAWLNEPMPAAPHLALIVVHANAVEPTPGSSNLGSYDVYVPPRLDQRIEIVVQGVMRESIIDARVETRDLNRQELSAIMSVPRVRSTTVGADGERNTVFGLNIVIPAAFMGLLIMGVMFAGQGMLTTTVEEKSNRVIEVLLSAVSPMQLMGGKLLGHMGISLLAMSLYLGFGLIALVSFSLFGLLDVKLILYLLIFYLIAFFTIGSLMMGIGAAANEMREAQQLMMPLMLTMFLPWILWWPIVQNPSSTLAVVVSFVPPINSFGMLLRVASAEPPPAWQVWLSIGFGIAGAFAALWVAAKIFRIGILMFGKPPDLKTLVAWVRAA
ncbi:MAG TPA: ABC transporter permease [Gammaproteobacteria bacterium]